MLDNLKILHEQMKDQYDLLILKMNTINQENFSLKRELYFYQNNSNNNLSNNSNYNSNNNNNNNILSVNEKNKFENEYEETKSFKSNYNNMKIDIENNNNQYNLKKINKDRIENNKINYNNENDEIIPIITNSHRKFVGNINQNDSSGV